jgi:predicted esterase
LSCFLAVKLVHLPHKAAGGFTSAAVVYKRQSKLVWGAQIEDKETGDSGRTRMSQHIKIIAGAAVLLAQCTCLQALDANVLPEPEMISKQSLDGRQVIRYEHASRKQWGYEVPQKDYFNFLPAKADMKNAPLRVVLHSGGGSGDTALDFAFKNKGWFHFYEGDDYHVLYLDCRKNQDVDWWWGYHEIKRNPDRYKDKLTPTEQRVLGTIEWVARAYDVDRNRIYLSGISMGGSGSLGIGLLNGDIFAAISVCVPAGVEHMESRMTNGMQSDPPPLFNFSSHLDRWSKGQERLLAAFEKNKYSLFFAWAPFGHSSDVSTANPAVVEFPWLSIRKNEAYPVFTRASTDHRYPGFNQKTAPDQSGQINGYLRWKNLEDSAERFAMELRLIKKEELSRPIEVPMESVGSVSLRRLQTFEVRKGTSYQWSLRSGEDVLDSGSVTVGEDGVLTIPAVTISSLPKRLEVSSLNGASAESVGGP